MILALLGVLGFSGLHAAFGLDFDRLQKSLIERFGPGSMIIFSDWRRMLGESAELPDREKLRRVNDFFNQRLVFSDDIIVWGKHDYWATPLETMGRGAGDCEDFTIAKYFSLIDLGVPLRKLRLVYVRALVDGPGGRRRLAHMVLAYYPTPNGEPLLLDNLNTRILPARQRPDLSPVFSFNSAGLWQGAGNQSSGSSLSRWQDLLARARADGFQ